MPKIKEILKNYIDTPYGEVFRNEWGELELQYITTNFSEFSPNLSVDNEIDSWLIDNDYKILSRDLYFNDPIVETLNYVYYNEHTNDYEEVEVPVGYSDGVDVGSFMLRYKLEKK